MKNKLVYLLLACILSSAQVHALFPRLAYRAHYGSNQYIGHEVNVMINLPLDLYVNGAVNAYKSDRNANWLQEYAAAVGWRGEVGMFEVHGRGTPERDGYKSITAGVEGGIRVFSIGSEDTKPLRLYLLAGYDKTLQTDGTYTATEIVNGAVQTRQVENDLAQNDYMGGAELRVFWTSLLGKFIKSDYQQTSFQTARRTPLVGVSVYRRGYPDQISYFKLTQNVTELFYAFGSYSNIKFKFGPETFADSYVVGAGFDLLIFRASAEYNRYRPSTGPLEDYYGFGLGLLF